MKLIKIFRMALISIIGFFKINSSNFSENSDINNKIEPVEKNIIVDNSEKNENGIYYITLQYYIKKELEKKSFLSTVDEMHKKNMYYVYIDSESNERSYRKSIYYNFYTTTYKSENEKYDLRVILYICVKLNNAEPQTTFTFKLYTIDTKGNPIEEIKNSEIEITILQQDNKNQNNDKIQNNDTSESKTNEKIKTNEILTDEKYKTVKKENNIKQEIINTSDKKLEENKIKSEQKKIELEKNNTTNKDISIKKIKKLEQKENKKEENNNIENKASSIKKLIVHTSNTNIEDKTKENKNIEDKPKENKNIEDKPKENKNIEDK